MALELFPTPSWPQPDFTIPLAGEFKKFPGGDQMATKALKKACFSESTDDEAVITRWASDCTNLYLEIELAEPLDSSKERAWRHGDGCLLTVSHVCQQEHVGCYTSLGLAGTSKKPQVLVVNRSGNWFPGDDCSKVRYRLRSGKEKSIINATIPWATLYPVRPLLYETISLNLTFIRQGATGRSFYQLVEDEHFDTELTSGRKTLPVKFNITQFSQAVAQSFLTRSVWYESSPILLNLGMYNPGTGPAKMDVVIKDGSKVVEKHSSAVELAPGTHNWTINWSPQRPLRTGEYVLELSGKGSSRSYKKKHSIYVVNMAQVAEISSGLQELEEDIQCLYPGAVHTALANLDWLLSKLDTCESQPPNLKGFFIAKTMLEELREGKNPLEDKPGLSTRAYRSTVDGSIQGYSLYLPKGFSGQRKWPLLTFLHGSGVDETSLANRGDLQRLADKLGFILLFPRARNRRGFYLNQDEQDVLQAMGIVKNRLSVDWDNLFIAGYSMGGFGAWHTGLRKPNLFKGIASISGVCTLPFMGETPVPGYEFDPRAFADNVKSLPILVVHGTQDKSVPIDQVRVIAEDLQKVDAPVTFKEVDGAGHQDYDWVQPLGAWLRQIMK